MSQLADSLVVTGLSAGYGASFALSGVEFRVGPGDLLGLVGPNGAGKSTVLKAIAGVIPMANGAATLGGRPVRRLGGRVAFVPQREEVNWDFPATAGDVVLMGRYRSIGWLRRPRRADRAAAEAALDRLGLGGAGDRHISQFSGGQQQRIFLARAVAQDPALMLLDEPYTGIDAANREVLARTISAVRGSGGIVLMATHDLDEVQRVCSHVLFLNRRQVAFGPVGEAYTVAHIRATFGGSVAVFA